MDNTLRTFIRSVLTEQVHADYGTWVAAVNAVLTHHGEPQVEDQGIPNEMLQMRFDRGDSPEKVVNDMMGFDEQEVDDF